MRRTTHTHTHTRTRMNLSPAEPVPFAHEWSEMILMMILCDETLLKDFANLSSHLATRTDRYMSLYRPVVVCYVLVRNNELLWPMLHRLWPFERKYCIIIAVREAYVCRIHYAPRKYYIIPIDKSVTESIENILKYLSLRQYRDTFIQFL